MKIQLRTVIGTLVLAVALAAPLVGPVSPASPAGAAGDRAHPTQTLRSSEYTVETIFVPFGEPPTANMVFRRTDDVGSQGTEPDGHGFVQHSGWGDVSGRRCLTSGGGVFSFPDAADHTFTYGLAGRRIARIRIVEAGGHVVRVRPGPAVHFEGFRAWLVERPGSAFDRIEGLDAHGRVVATIPAGGGPFADDFGLSQATC
jgi:hypothetical protein